MKNYLLKLSIFKLALGIVLVGCRTPQTSNPEMVMTQPGFTPAVQSGRTLADINLLKNTRLKSNVLIDSIAIAETAELYRISTDGIVRQRPVTLADGIIIGDEKGYVYKVSPKGNLVWKVKVIDPDTSLAKRGFQAGGTAGDGLVIMASADGQLLGISPDSGAVVWQNKILEHPDLVILTDLIYYDGLAYAGVNVISFNEAKNDSSKTNVNGQPKHNKIIAFEPYSGAIVWEKVLVFPAGYKELTESFAIDPRAKMIYFTASNSYDSLSVEVVAGALDLKSGEFKWLSNFTIGGKGTTVSSPVLSEKSENGTTMRLMQAVTSAGKQLTWERTKGKYLGNSAVQNDATKDSLVLNENDLPTSVFNRATSYQIGNYIFHAAPSGKLICQSNLSQEVEWESSHLGKVTGPLWYHNGFIYMPVFNEKELKPELIVFQLGVIEEPYFIRLIESK